MHGLAPPEPLTQELVRLSFEVTPTAYQRKIFGDNWPELARVAEYLTFTHAHLTDPNNDQKIHPLARLGYKRAACCATPTIQVAEDQQTIIIAQGRCKSRLCPLCGRARARRLMYRLRELVKAMDSPRALTLTIAHSDQPLRDQIKHLTTSFHELRRTPVWKKHVLGGVYVIEITFNLTEAQWHPHLHVIIDGTYFPHADLKAAWLVATGDSDIVDIRKINSQAHAAKYLTDYLTQSQDASRLDDDRLPEWATQLHGMRLAQTFGASHAVPRSEDDELPTRGFKAICGINRLFSATLTGDPIATQIWDDVKTLVGRNVADSSTYDPLTHQTRIAQVVDRLRDWHGNGPDYESHIDGDAAERARRRYRDDQRRLWDGQDHNPPPPD